MHHAGQPWELYANLEIFYTHCPRFYGINYPTHKYSGKDSENEGDSKRGSENKKEDGGDKLKDSAGC